MTRRRDVIDFSMFVNKETLCFERPIRASRFIIDDLSLRHCNLHSRYVKRDVKSSSSRAHDKHLLSMRSEVTRDAPRALQ